MPPCDLRNPLGIKIIKKGVMNALLRCNNQLHEVYGIYRYMLDEIIMDVPHHLLLF